MKSKILLFLLVIFSGLCYSVKADQYWCGNLTTNKVGNGENIYVTCTVNSNGYDVSIYNCNVYFNEGTQLVIESGDVFTANLDMSLDRNVMCG